MKPGEMSRRKEKETEIKQEHDWEGNKETIGKERI